MVCFGKCSMFKEKAYILLILCEAFHECQIGHISWNSFPSVLYSCWLSICLSTSCWWGIITVSIVNEPISYFFCCCCGFVSCVDPFNFLIHFEILLWDTWRFSLTVFFGWSNALWNVFIMLILIKATWHFIDLYSQCMPHLRTQVQFSVLKYVSLIKEINSLPDS